MTEELISQDICSSQLQNFDNEKINIKLYCPNCEIRRIKADRNFFKTQKSQNPHDYQFFYLDESTNEWRCLNSEDTVCFLNQNSIFYQPNIFLTLSSPKWNVMYNEHLNQKQQFSRVKITATGPQK